MLEKFYYERKWLWFLCIQGYTLILLLNQIHGKYGFTIITHKKRITINIQIHENQLFTENSRLAVKICDVYYKCIFFCSFYQKIVLKGISKKFSECSKVLPGCPLLGPLPLPPVLWWCRPEEHSASSDRVAAIHASPWCTVKYLKVVVYL